MDIAGKAGPLVTTPNHLAITPGVNVHGAWAEPVPELITGELATWMSATSVTPARVPGYWTYKKGFNPDIGAPPTPGEKVVYLMHGGAYIRLSAHPTDPTAAIARGLVQHIGSVHRAFSIEYRLASHKPYPVANPFPAALLDALAGYNYLVDVVGFTPSNIIIAGDSAGGNLAHALTRYLIEYKDTPGVNLPAPAGALILLSPWMDLSTSHEVPGSSAETCAPSDYIRPIEKGIHYAKDAFLGPLGIGAASHNKYISPASLHPSMTVDFKGFPRTFIVAGGAEVLLDQIRTFRERMAKDLDDKHLKYVEAEDGIHDYLVFEWHEPERTDTLKQIGKWVDN
ncbi:Alpha/Beta hydrolase protein [Collybia nuda]|uniref:Alpha/Beta hydrolase protein n=1 Tax=Collybia nuda TaxID=64659 RepID=A0A9P5YBX0_9AGAR|nr:Alpha/Beta hydrolase protein [Collybia nuda]